jgi:Uma2 family endonuclease
MRDTTAYRVDVRKYRKMVAAGVFGDDKVELLGGILTMMTTSPPHDYAVTKLGDLLEDLLPRDRWTVREEKPIHLGLFWRPIPDIAVVRSPALNYAARTPRLNDTALLVEVSDTTYAIDTGKKLRRYERCGVPTYWVVDLNRRRVEVREMTARGLDPVVLYGEDEEIPLVLDGHDYGRIAVRELLP